VFTDDAAKRLVDEPRVYDPRDFMDEETVEHWWMALAFYGSILFAAGALASPWDLTPLTFGIFGLLMMVFLGIVVLTFAGLEAGVAVWVAGASFIAAAAASSYGTLAASWTAVWLLLIGAACAAVGAYQAVTTREIDLEEEAHPPAVPAF
jgi:hypothetical protein